MAGSIFYLFGRSILIVGGLMFRFRLLLAALTCALLATACTPDAPDPAAQPSGSTASARAVLPPDLTTVVKGTTAAALAVATSRALFAHAPAVVLASSGQTEYVLRQGVEMGRPSRITIQLRKDGDTLIHGGIGGDAVVIGQGSLDLDD